MSNVVKSTRTELNSQELKGYLEYIIDNNRFIQGQGKVPVTLNIEGAPGLGKTSVIKQIAEQKELRYIRINLAMLDELSDLVGFPVRQFQLCKKEDLMKFKPVKRAGRKPAVVKELVEVAVLEVTPLVLPPKPESKIAAIVVKQEIVKVPTTIKKQVLEGGKFIFKDVETFTDVEQDVEDTETMLNNQATLDAEYNTELQAWELEVARLEKEHEDLVSTASASLNIPSTQPVVEVEDAQVDIPTTSEACLWIDEHAIDEYIKQGYQFTGAKRMSYCPPEWIANAEGGLLLLLDDYSRADQRFVQATMSLIETQEYISWKLPLDSHIVLSTNPDDGENFVTALDKAQSSRFLSSTMKFDVDCWAEWAEKEQIDTRCINFLLLNPEVICKEVNPRSATMFFNALSSIEDFEAQLPLVQRIGESAIGADASMMFSMFINNKLDKLITPKDMLLKEGDTAMITLMKDCIGTPYRADIAATLATRLINYTLTYAENNTISDKIIKRLTMFMTHADIFTDDLKYVIVKRILNGNKGKFQRLMLDTDIIAMTIK